MTSKSKQKGNGFERELVNYFKSKGLDSRRAWGSNGQSLGEHEEVDLTVDYMDYSIDTNFSMASNAIEPNFMKIQAKRRKKIPKFLGLTEHVNAAIFREDQGESYILMRLNDFTERFLL